MKSCLKNVAISKNRNDNHTCFIYLYFIQRVSTASVTSTSSTSKQCFKCILKIAMSLNSLNPSNSFNKGKRKKATLAELRIAVLGEQNVGKTAIVVRFITRRFIIEYERGTNKRYKHKLIIENEPIIFDILDLSLNSSLMLEKSESYFHEADVFLLIYSITDRQSFNYIRTLLRHIAQFKSNNPTVMIPLVGIVGNKNDLIHLRQVSREEGEILRHENSDLTTIYLGEFSAAEMTLQSMFIELFKWVKRQKLAIKASTGYSLLDRMVIGIKGTTNGF